MYITSIRQNSWGKDFYLRNLRGCKENFFTGRQRGIPGPENVILISLNTRVIICQLKTFFSEASIVFIYFNTKKISTKFFCDNRCGSGSPKGIKNNFPRAGGGLDNFC